MSQEDAGEDDVGLYSAAHNFSPRNAQEVMWKFKILQENLNELGVSALSSGRCCLSKMCLKMCMKC